MMENTLRTIFGDGFIQRSQGKGRITIADPGENCFRRRPQNYVNSVMLHYIMTRSEKRYETL